MITKTAFDCCLSGNYIKTVGGTGGGRPCIFPFVYKGEKYHSCVSEHSYKYYWCVVDQTDESWGHCIISEYLLVHIKYTLQKLSKYKLQK